MILLLHITFEGNSVEMESISTGLEKLRVTKANRLIETCLIETTTKLSLRDQKVVLSVVSQVSPNDDDLKTYSLSIKELSSLTGINKNNLYREVSLICRRLVSSVITIKEPGDEKGFLMVTWFSHARYVETNGVIEFSISPELKPYLLKLKSQFTTYHLNQVVSLQSVYSIRIYELLRQFFPLKDVESGKTSSFREITLDDLRGYLGVDNGKYPKFALFRKNIIERSQAELKEKTDICFDFEPIRKGRKVSSIRFLIKHNQDFKGAVSDDAVNDGFESDLMDSPMVEMMKIHFEGIADDEIYLVVSTYSDLLIKESLIDYMQAMFSEKIKGDNKAYFLGILKNKNHERRKTTNEKLLDRSWDE